MLQEIPNDSLMEEQAAPEEEAVEVAASFEDLPEEEPSSFMKEEEYLPPSIFSQDQLVESPSEPSTPVMLKEQPKTRVHFSEEVESQPEEEKFSQTVRKGEEDPQCGYYRSLLAKVMAECQVDPDKIQDLAELIFEVKQNGLDAWIDLSDAEDLVF